MNNNGTGSSVEATLPADTDILIVCRIPGANREVLYRT
jgi:hypothetical protein